MKDKKKTVLQYALYVAILAAEIWLIVSLLFGYEVKTSDISYNEFRVFVEEGRVQSITYSDFDEYMTVFLTEEENGLKCLYPSYDDFRKEMLEAGVELRVDHSKATTNGVLSFVSSLVVPIIFLYFLFSMMQKSQGVQEKTLVQTSDVKFSDVIGHDEVIDEVRFVSELIKNSQAGKTMGVSVPKGLLFDGPPGTGKTLLAKAIAGEAGVKFLSVNSSSMIEMFVGVGAKRVREVFETAKKNAPCVVFFDEIDAIGRNRDASNMNSENEQTINALLQEMDGFTGREGVFVIAATNRGDKLDPALTRAGRFDRKVYIGPPRDWTVRNDLFKFYLRGKKTDETVDTEKIAKQTSGFTGADIEAVCNEAGIIAMMQRKKAIDIDCIEESIDKKVFHGSRSKKQQFEKDRQVVAYHEAGHAVAHLLYKEPIARATIAGTISGVGGVVFGEDKETQFRTKDCYETMVKICYAGRIAEEIQFGFATQGASSDIEQATSLLYEYVSNLGFSEEFGMINLDVLSRKQVLDKSNFFELIQAASKRLYAEAKSDLKEAYNLVETIAKALLDQETLSGEEIEKIALSAGEEA